MEEKICNQCGHEKALEQFYKVKAGSDARRAICKKCHNANVMANRDPVAYAEYMRIKMAEYRR